MTFILTTIAWIFFRAESVEHGVMYLINIVDYSLFSFPQLITPKLDMIYTILLICVLLFVEWLNREKAYGLEISNYSQKIRWTVYIVILFLIISFGVFRNDSFIYFQF